MQREIDRLRSEVFDIIVVGGGMHGAWVALRATQAGYRVALLERQDFGAATSANSLKILHGGLRYLQHLDFGRMRSSIRARREFAACYPEWIQPLPCVMPLQAMGVRSPWILGPALLANDLLSADRNSGLKTDLRLPNGRLISASECARRLAPLATRQPFAGAIWWDAVAVDTARLGLMPVLAAADAGAVVANRVAVTSYLLQDHAIQGVSALDQISGESFQVRAAVVVNATGPWAGELARASDLTDGYMPPGWVGGMNLVLNKSLGLESAVALSAESKAADNSALLSRATRELFFVPWRNRTMVGTDYLPVTGVQDLIAGPPSGAVSNFVDEIARVAPNAYITLADVALVHWGLLPLASAGDSLPSKSPVLVAGRQVTGASGLVVVIGEKLTSAPELSKQVLKLIHAQLGQLPTKQAIGTSNVSPRPMMGAASSDAFSELVERRLKSRYGGGWLQVASYAAKKPELLDPIHTQSAVLGVEVVHAIRHEMALSLDDIVMRRVGMADAGPPEIDALQCCVEIAAGELEWNEGAKQKAVIALAESLTAGKASLYSQFFDN